ncbi:MAG: hypothetical protein ACJ76H_06670 [Bacteriovoracaceae bacterium]
MLARMNKSKGGKSAPQEWLEGLSRLLNDSYKRECKEQGRYFDVYGQIYPGELLLIVSWLSETDEYVSPVTLFLSCEADQVSSVKKVKDTQENYVELVGLFFDEILAAKEWDEFEPLWQEVSHKNQNYWYKITRENINVTLEANKLLGEDFDDEMDEEIDQ